MKKLNLAVLMLCLSGIAAAAEAPKTNYAEELKAHGILSSIRGMCFVGTADGSDAPQPGFVRTLELMVKEGLISSPAAPDNWKQVDAWGCDPKNQELLDRVLVQNWRAVSESDEGYVVAPFLRGPKHFYVSPEAYEDIKWAIAQEYAARLRLP